MLRFAFLLLLLCTTSALAQSDAGAPSVTAGEPDIPGEAAPEELQFREPGSDYRWFNTPAVGSCIGGSCGGVPPPVVLAPPERTPPSITPRMRFASTGAVLGVVSAGLLLGSSLAIAFVDDHDSERVTRGAWLGYLVASTGVVALSAQLARNELGGGSSAASKATRSVGWTAFTLALADGAILWAGAFQDFQRMDVLTIGAGALAACALLPHALDAYVVGRGLRARQLVKWEPLGTGLRVRF